MSIIIYKIKDYLSYIIYNEAFIAINLWNKYKDGVYYLKAKNLDADFFVEETGEVIQVAYSFINISNNRETKALIEASKTVKEAKSFTILTWEEEKELTVNDLKIKVIPVWKYLIKN